MSWPDCLSNIANPATDVLDELDELNGLDGRDTDGLDERDTDGLDERGVLEGLVGFERGVVAGLMVLDSPAALDGLDVATQTSVGSSNIAVAMPENASTFITAPVFEVSNGKKNKCTKKKKKKREKNKQWEKQG